MKDQEKNALIQYRLQQAEETCQLAKFLLENKKLAVAMNRIYYGMFYALSSLALKEGFETSKHLQLLGWFNKNFVLSGKTNANYGKTLRRAFQYRAKGDYDAFVSFEVEEIEMMIVEMEDFIMEIERLIYSSEK